MTISYESSGSFDSTEAWLNRISRENLYGSLAHYGQEGVSALAAATPVESGLTAQGWTYEILQDTNSYSIVWGNTNIEDGRPVAILLQYGHGTRTGGYVQGRDYINPALQPIFDRIAADVWRVVTA
jgi:hypothetical protein